MKSIVIDADCAEIVVGGIRFVRTTSEPAATPATPAAPKKRKSGPRKQGDDETDLQYAARVERYDTKHGKPAAAPEAATQQPAVAAATLPTREAKPAASRKGFTTTLCKCRGAVKTANKQGTYGKPGYVAAVYEETQDFSAFGIEGALELPAGTALCGTFLKKDMPTLYPPELNGKMRKVEPNEVFDGAVYHSGHGEKHGDWLQIALFDDNTETTGNTKPMNGKPLFKARHEIVELFSIACKCGNCNS